MLDLDLQTIIELATSVAAVVGQIAVGLLAGFSWGRSPMAGPLALMSVGMATWTAAWLSHEFLQPLPGTYLGWWHYVDVAVSPLLPPLALNVVLRFTGSKPSLWERIGFGAALALGAVSGLAAVIPALQAFEQSIAWELCYALIANPIVFAGLIRLRRYLSRVAGTSERTRTHLLMSTLLVGWILALTEIVPDVWRHAVPRLGPAGVLITSVMLAFAVLRFDLLETRRKTLAFFALLAVVSVGIAVLNPRHDHPSLLATILLPSFLIASAIGWPILQTALERRRRQRHLALMGRMSAQISHDWLNPVNSIKGAVQFLLVEIDRGRAVAPHRRFLEEIERQARRLEDVVAAYQRLAAPSEALRRHESDLADVVREAQRSVPDSVEYLADLRPTRVYIDRPLVDAAIENVVKNAVQANRATGRIWISCEESDLARVSVEDEGPGIPPRERMQVFEDFHTTKATGTGLGLPFVRRVMEAHGGHVTLEDGDHGGLRVVLHFPSHP